MSVLYTPRASSSSLPKCRQCLSSLPRLRNLSTATTGNNSSSNNSNRKPLTRAQLDFLSSALRVNQAGELAATLIYAAQTPPLVRARPALAPLMRHMHAQEAGHLSVFDALLRRHRVRPTALRPLWHLAAGLLGWSTAAVGGREAAMACTEAVETEIGSHYNEQIRRLLAMFAEWEEEAAAAKEGRGGGRDDAADRADRGKGDDKDAAADGRLEEIAGPDLVRLVHTIRRIRDEELEHLDHAVEHDAKKADPHWLLTGVIRAGCRGAIWLSERI